MTAFIEDLQTAEAACAETMLVPLWAHIGQRIAVEPSALGEYLEPIIGTDDTPLDPEAVRITYEKEVEIQVTRAVEGYIDWAACRIVRNGDFEPIDLPIPSIVDTLSITSEYDVKAGVLRFVIERLREDVAVPLLGKMVNGYLVPDEAALKEWANFYDWGDLNATA